MMNNSRVVCCFLISILCFAPALAHQKMEASAAVSLTIRGEGAKEMKLGAADLAKLPHKSVQAKAHDGKTYTYTGVPLVDILSMAGVTFGEAIRGPKLSQFLLVGAADNYYAVFALPELDPAFTDKVVLLVDQVDGKPLAATEGPLRIVVPDEKRQARWVRQVTTLTIMRANPDGK